MEKLHFDGPVVLVIMDGVGLSPRTEGNSLAFAHLEFLRSALEKYPSLSIAASGESVGLVKGQMGNSEVGHNAIGSGQVLKQGTARVEDYFETGEIWQSDAWLGAMKNIKENDSTLHFSGIFSDGGVHSHISHLEKMIARAVEEGAKKIRIHSIFDGRDVPPQSEPKYIAYIEEYAKNFPTVDIKIASGGGRMTTVSDRYEEDWSRVERGWHMMVDGESENKFKSAVEAIESFRKNDPEIQDQNLPDFVVVDENQKPVGKVEKGDSFIYFDFRADRALEISMAFTYYDFPYFERKNYSPDDVYFAGMTEYNSDTHVPAHQLVPQVEFKNVLNTFLGEKGISQLAISEPSKFGHITYYFNGNSYEKAKGEEHIRIENDELRYDLNPWMAATKITDTVIENLDRYKFIRINYPNGDMVGHYAELEPGIMAVETVDLQLTRLAKKVDELGGMMLIVADHGNVEELLDENGGKMTSHTTNPVPCIFYDNTENKEKYTLSKIENPSIANIASTLSLLLGIDENERPITWLPPLINLTK